LAPLTCFLFDNGSFRPASTLALRRVAARLARELQVPVQATPLLHSHKVDPSLLGGVPAQLLEPALESYAEQGGTHAVALPLFFGPSGAMQDYLPPRLKELAHRFPSCRFQLAGCLESPQDDSAVLLAQDLAERITRTTAEQAGKPPAVILCDHGSPKPEVADVRNRIGVSLAQLPSLRGRPVVVASMERREGPEYAFNEPLLETALTDLAAAGQRKVVVALQFLAAGRHAGPGGDVVSICEEVQKQFPDLEVAFTDPLGESDVVRELLVRRFRQAITLA